MPVSRHHRLRPLFGGEAARWRLMCDVLTAQVLPSAPPSPAPRYAPDINRHVAWRIVRDGGKPRRSSRCGVGARCRRGHHPGLRRAGLKTTAMSPPARAHEISGNVRAGFHDLAGTLIGAGYRRAARASGGCELHRGEAFRRSGDRNVISVTLSAWPGGGRAMAQQGKGARGGGGWSPFLPHRRRGSHPHCRSRKPVIRVADVSTRCFASA